MTGTLFAGFLALWWLHFVWQAVTGRRGLSTGTEARVVAWIMTWLFVIDTKLTAAGAAVAQKAAAAQSVTEVTKE